MKAKYRNGLAAIALIGLAQPAAADVITDWNEKAVAYRARPQAWVRRRPSGSWP